MKSIILLSLALIASSAFAGINTYNITTDLTIKGKHIGETKVIANEGLKAEMRQKEDNKELFIEVVAQESEKQKGILMNFTVGYLGEGGKRDIIAKPQVIAIENEPAEISIGKKIDQPDFIMKVTAKRKTIK